MLSQAGRKPQPGSSPSLAQDGGNDALAQLDHPFQREFPEAKDHCLGVVAVGGQRPADAVAVPALSPGQQMQVLYVLVKIFYL